mmetsp:Transcript_73470/g.204104  ORF Transcript_73470/g.204104 Transcript_73470/m.204104 type:complete len:220 (-) Transcript_73470:98-757(-)
MGDILKTICARWLAAARTVPTFEQISATSVLFACSGAFCFTFGRLTGFLVASKPRTLLEFVKTAVRTFFLPALLEESVWRAMILPHPKVDGSVVGGMFGAPSWLVVLQMVLFVFYHIPSGHLLSALKVATGAASTFTDKRFLVICVALSATCTFGYLLSGGSLWVAAVLHHLPVVVWLELGGGDRKLRPEAYAGDCAHDFTIATSLEDDTVQADEAGTM